MSEPLDRCIEILRCALAIEIAQAQIILRFVVALLCRFLEFFKFFVGHSCIDFDYDAKIKKKYYNNKIKVE